MSKITAQWGSDAASVKTLLDRALTRPEGEAPGSELTSALRRLGCPVDATSALQLGTRALSVSMRLHPDPALQRAAIRVLLSFLAFRGPDGGSDTHAGAKALVACVPQVVAAMTADDSDTTETTFQSCHLLARMSEAPDCLAALAAGGVVPVSWLACVCVCTPTAPTRWYATEIVLRRPD